MKHVLVCLAVMAIFSCKQKTNKSLNTVASTQDKVNESYPENILKIFEAHGGLKHWKAMKTFEFIMEKPDGQEVTLVDLKNRKTRITLPKFDIGYDGSSVWVFNKDTLAYEGNAKFYYNLMFYFNAMPFVLADKGISYAEAEPLLFEGKTYPGIKISFENGVGESSDDNYILYYDATTYKMAWLAYTVTYFSKEKSKNFSFIKYDKWQEVNGLLLPKVLQWHNVENNLPTTKINDVEIAKMSLSTKAPEKSVFNKPEQATMAN